MWIEGETGVGKEQVAQALHAASGRSGAFVAVNVCAIADSMFEDAFFGHVRGAFTGASDQTYGYFGEADGGTIFLDEIGALSLESQAKLLRAVETARYRQVGARADRKSCFRVIAASNVPWQRLVQDGRFRADLGYRLRGAVLKVPALRERPEDIRALAERFLSDGVLERSFRLAPTGLAWLETQLWSGNVRELRQMLHCAQVLATGGSVGVTELKSARAMIPPELRESVELDDALLREREELRRLLRECLWDTAIAAVKLGVDRTTVYRRMRRLGVDAKHVVGKSSSDAPELLADRFSRSAPA